MKRNSGISYNSTRPAKQDWIPWVIFSVIVGLPLLSCLFCCGLGVMSPRRVQPQIAKQLPAEQLEQHLPAEQLERTEPPRENPPLTEKDIPDGDFKAAKSGDYVNPVQLASGKTVYVRGYFRADGTYVAPHIRAAPGTAVKGGTTGKRK